MGALDDSPTHTDRRAVPCCAACVRVCSVAPVTSCNCRWGGLRCRTAISWVMRARRVSSGTQLGPPGGRAKVRDGPVG